MDDNIFEVSVDKERAKSLLKMVKMRLQRIRETDKKKYASFVLEEYYDVINELITAVLLLDGYKTLSHKVLIEYVKENYGFSGYEISLMDELRITRNRIRYEGFSVRYDYLQRKRRDIIKVIHDLKKIVSKKLAK